MAKQGSRCELCGADAKMFCESDQARLCWDCDDKVHAANFLVAKHIRTALCHVCHSPTPWKAAGPRLGRTVSVCGVCVVRSAGDGGRSVGNRGEIAEEEEEEEERDARSRSVRIAGEGGGGFLQREEVDDDDECDDDDSEDDDDSDDGDFGGCDNADDNDDDDENQVVPWTSTPPPPASGTSTSSSEEEESSSFGDGGGESVSVSRIHDLAFSLHFSGKIGVRGSSSSSMAARSRLVAGEDEEILRGQFVRPWKLRRVALQP